MITEMQDMWKVRVLRHYADRIDASNFILNSHYPITAGVAADMGAVHYRQGLVLDDVPGSKPRQIVAKVFRENGTTVMEVAEAVYSWSRSKGEYVHLAATHVQIDLTNDGFEIIPYNWNISTWESVQ